MRLMSVPLLVLLDALPACVDEEYAVMGSMRGECSHAELVSCAEQARPSEWYPNESSEEKIEKLGGIDYLQQFCSCTAVAGEDLIESPAPTPISHQPDIKFVRPPVKLKEKLADLNEFTKFPRDVDSGAPSGEQIITGINGGLGKIITKHFGGKYNNLPDYIKSLPQGAPDRIYYNAGRPFRFDGVVSPL